MKEDRKGKKGAKFNKSRTDAEGNEIRRFRRKRVCFFCVEKIDILNFQNTALYKRFINDRGKISKKRIAGVCSWHQRKLAKVIKRARAIGLVPYKVD